MSLQNLSKDIDWLELLPALGITTETGVLPYYFTCPLNKCQGQMVVHADKTAGGTWFYCDKCNFAGDGIELASAFWGDLDVPTTIQKLLACGLDLGHTYLDAKHIDGYCKKRARDNELAQTWQRARLRLVADDNVNLRRLQQQLNIKTNLSKERWLNGPGLFVGGSEKFEIDYLFFPSSVQKSEVGSTNKLMFKGKMRNSIFSGYGWTDVLMIPLMDMPGRIKSFILYGREGRIPSDVFFKLINYRGITDDNCGIAMYDAIKYNKDKLIVTNEPLTALKIHYQYLQEHSEPMPLVSMHTVGAVSTTTDIWEQVRQPLTFWGIPNALLFKHARATNSKICFAGFTHEGPHKNITQTTPEDWLIRIEEEAKPWDIALEEMLMSLPLNKAEEILMGMGLEREELDKFVASGPEQLQEALSPVLAAQSRQTITFGTSRISENMGWYETDKHKTKICDAILRIDKIICHPFKEDKFYEGRILFKDKEINFLENSKQIEEDTFGWMQAKVMRELSGYMDYEDSWNTSAIRIANRFHTPEVVTGFDIVGWNKDKSCFVFPKFRIFGNGNVTDEKAVQVYKKCYPCLAIESPTPLTDLELAILGEFTFLPSLWALITCIATNVLSPIFSETPLLTVLTEYKKNKGYISVLKAVGCSEFNLTNNSINTGPSEEYMAHNWPLLITSRAYHEDVPLWVLEQGNTNLFVAIAWHQAYSLFLRKEWNLIDTSAIIETDETRMISKIMPVFLQYIAKKRFKMPNGASLMQKVNTCLAEWITSVGGDGKTVLTAYELIVPQSAGFARRFITLLCSLLEENSVGISRSDFIESTKIEDFIYLSDKIFVSEELVTNKLNKFNIKLPHIKLIAAELLQAGFGEEYTYLNTRGWIINEDIWNKQLIAIREIRK